MLSLKSKQPKGKLRSKLLTFIAVLLMAGGLYIGLLASTPAIIYRPQPIIVKDLEKPKPGQNQLIIPKIGVNVAYGTDGKAALDRGAQWRFPDRGSPDGKGNFIVAAHRFVIAPTPWETNKKSPFYHIEKVQVGDQIIVDYKGKRYAYKVSEFKTVKPNDIEIEAKSKQPKMTLYSCGLGGARSDRLVIIAKLVGKVDIEAQKTNTPHQD